jgi:hypothetical protein
LLTCAACACPAQPFWESVYFHDEDDSSLTLLDLGILPDGHAIALGRLAVGRRTRTVLIETRDGGASWKVAPVSPEGLSLFFLNASDGLLVASDGLHRTSDGGASWKHVFKSKSLLRCHFLDRSRGFAAGLDKTAAETRDGGMTWTPIPAAAAQKVEAGRTAFTWLEFREGAGFITGFHKPRRRTPDMPEWADPESAGLRRQLPSLSITLQTIDGGATWRASMASMFGAIARLRIGPPGRAVSVIEFEPQFEWPSEVYEIHLASGKADRVYRERDRHVMDGAYLCDGSLVLAAVVTPGRMHHLPVAGPVRFLQRQGSSWVEMEVDYRASAARIALALSPDGAAWAYTDTGMILRLRELR